MFSEKNGKIGKNISFSILNSGKVRDLISKFALAKLKLSENFGFLQIFQQYRQQSCRFPGSNSVFCKNSPI
ncbi:hypothetical protein LEP1GSC089_1613 [Leptospira interrogans serovar Autumnalis str. LP101]|nr:hypothetical protein LEP1GSC080_0069 [Leptospira interrogans str. FPW2026]EMN56173.1 hypothetical protein LEP1GSC089_1613 [Leptospira interrogans serovar Autumnalis str. LP101]